MSGWSIFVLMGMNQTLEQYDAVISGCRDIFTDKTKDYGTAWRILRPSSLTDQIYIKARRIRSLELKEGVGLIDEGIQEEYIGIVNYCIMALIQLSLPSNHSIHLSLSEAEQLYDTHLSETRDLMIRKNHDYGEAWREMRVSSITDLILMKIIRTKSIEDNDGQTLISEGLQANYMDMLNYAAFALIRLLENSNR